MMRPFCGQAAGEAAVLAVLDNPPREAFVDSGWLRGDQRILYCPPQPEVGNSPRAQSQSRSGTG